MNELETSGPRYWKSLDDLAETPAFKDWIEREFPAGAAELEGVNRRQFMKVMAASFGLAGGHHLGGLRTPPITRYFFIASTVNKIGCSKLVIPYSAYHSTWRCS